MSLDVDCISLVTKKVGRWTNALCKYVSRRWYTAASKDKYISTKELHPNMMVFAVSTNNLELVQFAHNERVLQVASRKFKWIPNNDWLWTETTNLTSRQRPSASGYFKGNPDIFEFLLKSGYGIALDEVFTVIRNDNDQLLKMYLSFTNNYNQDDKKLFGLEMINATALKCIRYCIDEHPSIFDECHMVSAIRQDKVDIVQALKGLMNWPHNPCLIASEYGSSKCLKFMLQAGTPFDYYDCYNATDNLQCKIQLGYYRKNAY
uniref:Poxvirus-like ankyrin repeat protein n=1 Tax=Clandestinovirus TaxID=2831644 RepID=A0A8F8KKT9_9VIRU|nr:poxvirus-like ankyrin repeat protein [Clandestinovirus]